MAALFLSKIRIFSKYKQAIPIAHEAYSAYNSNQCTTTKKLVYLVTQHLLIGARRQQTG